MAPDLIPDPASAFCLLVRESARVDVRQVGCRCPFAGLFVEGADRYITIALAAISFVIGAFFTWRVERRRAEGLAAELASRLTPKIKTGNARLHLAVEQPAPGQPPEYGTWAGPSRRHYAQLSVTAATNEAVRNCQAHVTGISKLENGKPEQNLETLQNYARILRIPQHLLWFDFPGQSRLKVPRTADANRRNTLRFSALRIRACRQTVCLH